MYNHVSHIMAGTSYSVSRILSQAHAYAIYYDIKVSQHGFQSPRGNSFRDNTSDRRQSKTLLPIDERGLKIDRNSVFDCHFVASQTTMAIENYVSNYCLSTFVDSINDNSWDNSYRCSYSINVFDGSAVAQW